MFLPAWEPFLLVQILVRPFPGPNLPAVNQIAFLIPQKGGKEEKEEKRKKEKNKRREKEEKRRREKEKKRKRERGKKEKKGKTEKEKREKG